MTQRKTAPARTTKPAAKSSKKLPPTKKHGEIVGLLMIAVGLMLTLSIFIPSDALLFRFFRELLFGMFGAVCFLAAPGIIVSGIVLLANLRRDVPLAKMLQSTALFYLAALLLHLCFLPQLPEYKGYFGFIGASYNLGVSAHAGGGFVAALLLYPLLLLVDAIGSFIVCIIGILALSIALFDISVGKFVRSFIDWCKDRHNARAAYKKSMQAEQARLEKEEKKRKKNEPPEPDIFEPEHYGTQPGYYAQPVTGSRGLIDIPRQPIEDEEEAEILPPDTAPVIADEPLDDADIEVILDAYDLPLEDAPPAAKPSAKPQEVTYHAPPMGLLERPQTGSATSREEELARARQLEETLASFDITAKVIQIHRGPVITRYELQLAPGIKVSRVTNLSDDLSLGLATQGIRIEAPIPGKSAIGIEVPNRDKNTVYLRDILESDEFMKSDARLAVGLGKDIAGRPVVADLSRMPHILIAGATGSGKSVCINSIIISILYKYTPSEVRLIMVDPKVVELSMYNGIPHLLSPVVTDPKKAAGALNWAVVEMMDRYNKLADYKVRSLSEYNKLCKQKGEDTLPLIVILIDELADLMMVAPKDVEGAICRLAQMARAVGIHMVLATQRPSVDVITGLIKANVPSRIAFAVSSQVDSRVILDSVGADKLLGMGDMLYLPLGVAKPLRVQGAFVSDRESESIVTYIKESLQVDPEYNENIAESNPEVFDKPDDDADELLPEAVAIVIATGSASISLLQRRLRVGYARAARLVDEMEVRGYVTGYDGSKPRNVLIDKAKFEQIYGTSYLEDEH